MAFTNTYLQREYIGDIEYGIVKTTGVTADVNNLGTAFTIVPAVTGKVIKALDCWSNKAGTAVHATSTTLWLLTNSAVKPQMLSTTLLLSSVAVTYPFSFAVDPAVATDTVMITGSALQLVTSNTTNPTGGTAAAAFTVYTKYMIYTP